LNGANAFSTEEFEGSDDENLNTGEFALPHIVESAFELVKNANAC